MFMNPYTLETYEFYIVVNTRAIMKDDKFWSAIHEQNIEYNLGWDTWPPEMAVGKIWFKTEEDRNIAQMLL